MCTGQSRLAFSFPVAVLTLQAAGIYIYILQCCRRVGRCLFCFQLERPFKGADAFCYLFDRSRFDGCDLHRRKNGLSA